MAAPNQSAPMWQLNKYKFYRGDSVTMLFIPLDGCGMPANCSNQTDLVLKFRNQDGSILRKTRSVNNEIYLAVGGPPTVMLVTLSAAETAALKLGADQDIMLIVKMGDARMTIPILGAITTVDRPIADTVD